MSPLGGIISYIFLWWICFLCVLPRGTKAQCNSSHSIVGTEKGAPEAFDLPPKLLWTSVITFGIWGGLWFLFLKDYIPYKIIMDIMP